MRFMWLLSIFFSLTFSGEGFAQEWGEKSSASHKKTLSDAPSKKRPPKNSPKHRLKSPNSRANPPRYVTNKPPRKAWTRYKRSRSVVFVSSPIVGASVFRADRGMRKTTEHFDALYQGVAFLALMGSKGAHKDIKNHRADRNMQALQDICYTLVYRLGSPTAMRLTFPGRSLSGVSVSLRDEADVYRYMLSNLDPVLLLNRYVQGRRYRKVLQGLKGSSSKSREFVKKHKDDLAFADTISYYMGSLSKSAKLERQTRSHAVYKRYRQSLCAANSPRYNEVYSEVLAYSKEFFS